MKTTTGRLSLAFTVIGALAFSLIQATAAHSDDLQTDMRDAKSVTACANEIKTCGCTITKPGTYIVTANLTASQGLNANGDCLDVKAPNVFLMLNAFNITGASAGTGLHLMPSANNAYVDSIKGKGGTSTNNGTTISGWNVGVEIDSANGIVEDFKATGNGQAGIFLNKARNNNINDFQSSTNTVYGVWLKASSGNQINCADTFQNGNTGIYVGCSASGPTAKTCKGVGPSTRNKIYDTDAGTNSQGNGVAGVVLDLGSTKNVVTFIIASANPTDLIDNNPNCDNNFWFAGDLWKTSNKNCIQ